VRLGCTRNLPLSSRFSCHPGGFADASHSSALSRGLVGDVPVYPLRQVQMLFQGRQVSAARDTTSRVLLVGLITWSIGAVAPCQSAPLPPHVILSAAFCAKNLLLPLRGQQLQTLQPSRKRRSYRMSFQPGSTPWAPTQSPKPTSTTEALRHREKPADAPPYGLPGRAGGCVLPS
jgi:hypothetical protein